MSAPHNAKSRGGRRALLLGALLMIVSCAQSGAHAASPSLVSIQSAVTCPAPPMGTAVVNPPRRFTGPPGVVISHSAGYCAYIETTRGMISVRLRPEHAPHAVNDFVFLAQRGFYDGLTFFQVCPGTKGSGCPAQAPIALTGDPSATGTGGPGYTVPSDPVVGRYLFGALAMYGSDPAAIGSDFFISMGDGSSLERRYDIFGQVTDGIPALATLHQGDRILWVAVVATAPEP